MSTPRDVSHPIVRTYVQVSRSPEGKKLVHVRLYSRRHGLDRRGTGRTVKEAVASATRKLMER